MAGPTGAAHDTRPIPPSAVTAAAPPINCRRFIRISLFSFGNLRLRVSALFWWLVNLRHVILAAPIPEETIDETLRRACALANGHRLCCHHSCCRQLEDLW